VSSTDLHTTKLVDFNWNVTVIVEIQLPANLDDTVYSSASALPCMRTTMADGHKFLAVRRLSQRLLDRSKNAIFTYPTCIRRPRWWWCHQNSV